jgi:ribonucleoside-diphosphate reductase alpha chain
MYKPTVKINTKRIKIEHAEIGMFTRSFNIETEKDEFKEIINTFSPIVEKRKQHELLMLDNGNIVTSDIHPMLVFRDKWIYIPTSQVVIGDIVKDKNETNIIVDILVGREYDEEFSDIEVDGNNNYYATSNNSENMYVVHNSATCSFPGWHLEFERLIELKNNKGTDETRVRTVDYSIALNGTLYKRLITGGNITLFSPEEVPDLYELYYGQDINAFEELYEKYENSNKVTKKTISAIDFFSKIMTERFETGRIYIFNADNVNNQGPFYEAIVQSNPCQEIAIPTTPMGNEESLIALCTLAATNWGKFSKILTAKEEIIFRDCCQVLMRALDSLLDYQDYPNIAAERSTKRYRPLGVGIIGYAHWLAKAKALWGSDDALFYTETMMEKQSYYLIQTSIELAKEFGPIEVRTKYSDGLVPRDLTKIPVNEPLVDWDTIRKDLKLHGIRNALNSAIMPAETSATLSNETNGIEPPKSLITIKGSKDGVLPQVVPEYSRLNHAYQTLWNVDTKDYIKTVAVLQKHVDQSISANTSYDATKGEITMSRLIEDLFLAYKLNLKTLYYCQVNDGSGDDIVEDGCESGACKL